MQRIARALVLSALVVGLTGVLGAGQVASAQTGPIGYSVGDEDNTNECDFFSIDLSTGVATKVSGGDTVLCADGLTFAPDGTLYAFVNEPEQGIVEADLVTIDLTDGTQTVVGDLPPILIGNGGMTFDAAGNLWLYGTEFVGGECQSIGGQTCLWRVNPADASTEIVGALPDQGRGVFGLTASCDAGVLALSASLPNGFQSDASVDRVDTATAALDEIVATPTISFLPEGLDFDAAGELWAISITPVIGIGTVDVHNIDLATGEVTDTPVVNGGGDPFSGFLFGLAVSPPAPCPEPPPEPIVLEPTFTG